MAEDLMDKVFSFFSGENLTDDKQNMLKGIAKELGNSKFSKFFRVRSEEADPSFSSFLFSIYKTIYPIKEFYKDVKKQGQLKSLVVESCLDDNIRETLKRLDYAVLDEKSKTTPGEELIVSIQKDIDLLTNQFDIVKIVTANRRYELAGILGRFVNYDFAGFFKKFDPHFADGSFIIEPRFPVIKTILIVDQISEFLTVTQHLRPEDDWTSLLQLLKVCEGSDLVELTQFNNLIKTLRELHTTKILELMIQYTLRNPVWQYKSANFKETIGEDWLQVKKNEGAGYIAIINNAKKNRQIRALTAQIFESADLVRLENYTIQLSENFRKRNLDYFFYAEGLNYLKAFMDDFSETELKELCDILIIRGQWTNNHMSREMSESLHRVTECFQPILDLDIVMSEDGSDGGRLRSAMMRVDRDPTQARYINSILARINAEALEIINEAAQSLIVIGKHLKMLVEDEKKKHPELLINWKELKMYSKEDLDQRMVADYKKINYFIQLMRLCTQ
ncbi:MAG: DUF5312 family protein [Treponema sp.]|jgi:hypothetical protein|nr:DUF5312 family protein [Treponema sp.]